MKNLFLPLFFLFLSVTAKAQLSAGDILAGVKSHDKALHIKGGWIRDPYIVLGPDGKYYLTGTTPVAGDPREQDDQYNTGLGKTSIVGYQVQVWCSDDLAHWKSLGAPYSLAEDSPTFKGREEMATKNPLWAPELHWTGDCWALVYCPQKHSGLALSSGKDIKGPWKHPNPEAFLKKHDPSLFKDDDGTWYLLFSNTLIVPLKPDFAGLAGEPVRIDPSNRRIGHEGATMRKIGKKYVHFGTAWSTDQGRKGSYNLYYCTSDKVTGPYNERRFAGRFLGHGTPFQDKNGKWWCTAFFNGNRPPLDPDGIEKRDLREDAQTINKLGTTIVPLDVKILPDGDVYIRAIDPHYATPGPDEVQSFQ